MRRVADRPRPNPVWLLVVALMATPAPDLAGSSLGTDPKPEART